MNKLWLCVVLTSAGAAFDLQRCSLRTDAAPRRTLANNITIYTPTFYLLHAYIVSSCFKTILTSCLTFLCFIRE